MATNVIIKVQLFSSLYDKFIQAKESFDAYEQYIEGCRQKYDNELTKFRNTKNKYYEYVENEITPFIYNNDVSDENLYTFLKIRKQMNRNIVNYSNKINKYNDMIVEVLEKHRDDHKNYLDDLKQIIVKYPPKKGFSATIELTKDEIDVINEMNTLVVYDNLIKKYDNCFNQIPIFDAPVFDYQINILMNMKNALYQDKMMKIDARTQVCKKRKCSL